MIIINIFKLLPKLPFYKLINSYYELINLALLNIVFFTLKILFYTFICKKKLTDICVRVNLKSTSGIKIVQITLKNLLNFIDINL